MKELERTPEAEIAVYVDDTIETGYNELKKTTEQIPKTFEQKPEEYP